MAQILYKFDYRDYEVQLLRIEPLFIFHGRPVCHLYLKFIPYFGLSHLIKHPFYRSSGSNSGLPNTWLPFRGVDQYKFWFHKACRDPLNSNPIWIKNGSAIGEYGRFGHYIYQQLSKYLKKHQKFVKSLPEAKLITDAAKLCSIENETQASICLEEPNRS